MLYKLFKCTRQTRVKENVSNHKQNTYNNLLLLLLLLLLLFCKWVLEVLTGVVNSIDRLWGNHLSS